MKSCNLQTREVTERHTSENVAALDLQSVVQEWGIQDKLVAITTDNARNIVNATETQLQWQRLPCAAHSLQLGVRAGLALEPVSAVLTRCRKLGQFHEACVGYKRCTRVDLCLSHDSQGRAFALLLNSSFLHGLFQAAEVEWIQS